MPAFLPTATASNVSTIDCSPPLWKVSTTWTTSLRPRAVALLLGISASQEGAGWAAAACTASHFGRPPKTGEPTQGARRGIAFAIHLQRGPDEKVHRVLP